MPDIFHTFPIESVPGKVFEAITTGAGLDNWWTKSSEAEPETGGIYSLDFDAEYHWKGIVTKYKKDEEFELQMTESDADWNGTKVGFSLNNKNDITEVNFYHTGWPQNNEHYRISTFCWAMYLRILKRYIEFGEKILYEERLNV